MKMLSKLPTFFQANPNNYTFGFGPIINTFEARRERTFDGYFSPQRHINRVGPNSNLAYIRIQIDDFKLGKENEFPLKKAPWHQVTTYNLRSASGKEPARPEEASPAHDQGNLEETVNRLVADVATHEEALGFAAETFEGFKEELKLMREQMAESVAVNRSLSDLVKTLQDEVAELRASNQKLLRMSSASSSQERTRLQPWAQVDVERSDPKTLEQAYVAAERLADTQRRSYTEIFKPTRESDHSGKEERRDRDGSSAQRQTGGRQPHQAASTADQADNRAAGTEDPSVEGQQPWRAEEISSEVGRRRRPNAGVCVLHEAMLPVGCEDLPQQIAPRTALVLKGGACSPVSSAEFQNVSDTVARFVKPLCLSASIAWSPQRAESQRSMFILGFNSDTSQLNSSKVW
ncbi:hypothetical protein EJ110_NYTH03566 [Nymphaea thermarum]|nr:hypothetical protein EJ110_NYTH03566 [Nymphaea thermarum]